MQKAFNNFTWENLPSTNTALEADRLNGINNALDTVDDRVVAFDTTKANQSDMLQAVKTISFNSQTGTFRFTFFNNTYIDVDTDIEKIAINFDYDDDPTSPHYQNLIITLDDGTVKYVDMSALLTQYEFNNSSRISFSVVNGVVSADIINGSVTEEKLQPNFLADCRSAKAGAETAETNAKASEDEANAWANGEIDGVPVPSTHPAYHNNAKYYKDLANPTSLMALTDTDITNPASGDVLTFNGEKWENKEGISGEEKSATNTFETINGGILSSLKVALTPNQDLHGYDHPWVGGAGKNLLNSTLTGTVTRNGIVCVPKYDNGRNLIGYQLSGTATANADFVLCNNYGSTNVYASAGTYKINATGAINGIEFHNGYGTESYPQSYGNEDKEIVCNSGIAWSILRVASGTVINTPIFVQPMLRLSTESDPTFEPYSNECPISGHTQVDVDVMGKNLFDETYPNISQSIQYKAINVGEGTFTLKTNAPRYDNSGCPVFLLSGNVSSGATNNDHGAYDGSPRTQTAIDGYVTVAYRIISDIDPRNYDVFLYDNATRETYVINLGGTYYGGNLDVVGGVLTINRGYILFDGSQSFTAFGPDGQEFRYEVSDLKNSIDNLISSFLQTVRPYISWDTSGDSISVVGNGTALGIRLASQVTSATELKAYFAEHSLQVVYELATPTPIQLSPTMVKALVGENHLSAPLEGQEISEVKYNSIAKWNDVVQDDTTSLETTWSSDKINTDIETVASSVTALASRVGTNETNIAGLTTRVGALETNASKITWSNSVNALVDDTTVTISNANITTTSIIEPFYSNASGDNVVIKNQTATAGQVVLTFDALLEATSFRVRITNL